MVPESVSLKAGLFSKKGLKALFMKMTCECFHSHTLPNLADLCIVYKPRVILCKSE